MARFLAESAMEAIEGAETILAMLGVVISLMGGYFLFRIYPRHTNPKSVVIARVFGAILFIGGVVFAMWVKGVGIL